MKSCVNIYVMYAIFLYVKQAGASKIKGNITEMDNTHFSMLKAENPIPKSMTAVQAHTSTRSHKN